jgi:hypothetical protein
MHTNGNMLLQMVLTWCTLSLALTCHCRDDEILLRSVTSISCSSTLGGGHSFRRNRSSSLSTPAVTSRTAHATFGGTSILQQPGSMGDILACTPVRTQPLRSCPPGFHDSILGHTPALPEVTHEVTHGPGRSVTPPSPAVSHCTWHTSSETSPHCGALNLPGSATATTATAAAAALKGHDTAGDMDIDGDEKQQEITPRYAPSPACFGPSGLVPSPMPQALVASGPQSAAVPATPAPGQPAAAQQPQAAPEFGAPPVLTRTRSMSVQEATEEVMQRRREALHSALYLQPPSTFSASLFPAIVNHQLQPVMSHQAVAAAMPAAAGDALGIEPLPLPPLQLSGTDGLPPAAGVPPLPTHQRGASNSLPACPGPNPFGPRLSIKLLPFSSDNGSEEGTACSSARSTTLLTRVSGLSNACELLAAGSEGVGTPRASRAHRGGGAFGSCDNSILGQFGNGSANGSYYHARAASTSICDPAHPFAHPFLNTTSNNGNLLAVPLSPRAAALPGAAEGAWGSGSGGLTRPGSVGFEAAISIGAGEMDQGEEEEEEDMEEPATPTAAVAAAATESCSLLFRFLEQQPGAPVFPPPNSAADLSVRGNAPPALAPALTPAGDGSGVPPHNPAGTAPLGPAAWGSCPVPALHPASNTSVLEGSPLVGTTSCLVQQPSMGGADVPAQVQLMAAARAVRQYRAASIASRDSGQFRDQVLLQQ